MLFDIHESQRSVENKFTNYVLQWEREKLIYFFHQFIYFSIVNYVLSIIKWPNKHLETKITLNYKIRKQFTYTLAKIEKSDFYL